MELDGKKYRKPQSIYLMVKTHGFRCRFSQQNPSIDQFFPMIFPLNPHISCLCYPCSQRDRIRPRHWHRAARHGPWRKTTERSGAPATMMNGSWLMVKTDDNIWKHMKTMVFIGWLLVLDGLFNGLAWNIFTRNHLWESTKKIICCRFWWSSPIYSKKHRGLKWIKHDWTTHPRFWILNKMGRSPGDFFEQFLRISWGYCDIPDFEKRRLENNEAMPIQFFGKTPDPTGVTSGLWIDSSIQETLLGGWAL